MNLLKRLAPYPSFRTRTDLAWLLDLEGQVLEVSDGLLKEHPLSPAHWIGHPLAQPDGWLGTSCQLIEAHLKGHQAVSSELVAEGPFHTHQNVLLSVIPQWNCTGELQGFEVQALPLERPELHPMPLLEQSHTGFAIVSTAGMLLWSNPEFARRVGIPTETLLGRALGEWPGFEQLSLEAAGQSILVKSPQGHLKVHLTLLDQQAEFPQLLVEVHDHTEQHRLETEHQVVCQSTRVGVWSWNVPANHLEWDQQMFELHDQTQKLSIPALKAGNSWCILKDQRTWLNLHFGCCKTMKAQPSGRCWRQTAW